MWVRKCAREMREIPRKQGTQHAHRNILPQAYKRRVAAMSEEIKLILVINQRFRPLAGNVREQDRPND